MTLKTAEDIITEAQRMTYDYGAKIFGDDKTDQTERYKLAFQVGALQSLLRRVCRERDELVEELQLAVNEVCNSYVDAGHLARVTQRYGVKLSDEEEA